MTEFVEFEVVVCDRHYARIMLPPEEVLEVGRVTVTRRGIPQDPHMSARHFAVVYRNGQCHIRDLGSTNGTFVNGLRVTDGTLHDGDVVAAGGTTFVVRMRPDTTASDHASRQTVGVTAAPNTDEVASSAVPAAGRVAARQVAGQAVVGGDGPAPVPTAPTMPFFEITTNRAMAVSTVRWHDLENQSRLSIVVKATLIIDPAPELATHQLPIFSADTLSPDNAHPVRFESDLVPFKPRTDVVLVGRAHAAGGRPVDQLVAGLRVGSLNYAVAVFGDRTWVWPPLTPTPGISPPAPFTNMDLVYARAFGGIDGPGGMYCKENLIGTGFVGKVSREQVDGLRLPNLEDPKNLIRSWDTRPKPVGFGFYGRGWMPRLAYAGTYDEKYMKGRHPLPPEDFSYAFFNGAHPDLQVEGCLRGDEEVVLLNVCPRDPEMRFRLPGIVPKIMVSRWTVPPDQWLEDHLGPDGSVSGELPLADETVTPVLDTLVFVPDEGIFYQVFRGVCRLSSLESMEIARITVTA